MPRSQKRKNDEELIIMMPTSKEATKNGYIRKLEERKAEEREKKEERKKDLIK
jgi:hypothetical protein